MRRQRAEHNGLRCSFLLLRPRRSAARPSTSTAMNGVALQSTSSAAKLLSLVEAPAGARTNKKRNITRLIRAVGAGIGLAHKELRVSGRRVPEL